MTELTKAVKSDQQPEDDMPIVTRVIPLLVYEDLSAAHDFLVQAFGFESGGVEIHEGEPVHAELRSGEFVIWLHRVSPEHNLESAKSLPAASGGLVVHVDNVDAHFERARSAKAYIETEPKDMPYGQREYGARDPEGHRWWFATPLR